MTQYHANSRPDMEAQINIEGDAIARAGFKKLPKFADKPEDYREPVRGFRAPLPVTQMEQEPFDAIDEAAVREGLVVEGEGE